MDAKERKALEAWIRQDTEEWLAKWGIKYKEWGWTYRQACALLDAIVCDTTGKYGTPPVSKGEHISSPFAWC